MRTKRASLLASVVVLALSPLAAAHGLARFGATTSLLVSEPQMQAQASEAPAWHTGDGSVYDTSQGRVIVGAPHRLATNE